MAKKMTPPDPDAPVGTGGPQPDELALLAGRQVSDHVEAVLRAAAEHADAVRAEADADASRTTAESQLVLSQALNAARAVLAKLTAVEGGLRSQVDELRDEATTIAGGEALPTNEPDAPAALPTPPAVLLRDVSELTANLRAVLDGPRQLPEPGNRDLGQTSASDGQDSPVTPSRGPADSLQERLQGFSNIELAEDYERARTAPGGADQAKHWETVRAAIVTEAASRKDLQESVPDSNLSKRDRRRAAKTLEALVQVIRQGAP